MLIPAGGPGGPSASWTSTSSSEDTSKCAMRPRRSAPRTRLPSSTIVASTYVAVWLLRCRHCPLRQVLPPRISYRPRHRHRHRHRHRYCMTLLLHQNRRHQQLSPLYRTFHAMSSWPPRQQQQEQKQANSNRQQSTTPSLPFGASSRGYAVATIARSGSRTHCCDCSSLSRHKQRHWMPSGARRSTNVRDRLDRVCVQCNKRFESGLRRAGQIQVHGNESERMHAERERERERWECTRAAGSEPNQRRAAARSCSQVEGLRGWPLNIVEQADLIINHGEVRAGVAVLEPTILQYLCQRVGNVGATYDRR